MKPLEASRTDRIQAYVVQALYAILSPLLVELYNASLQTRYFPIAWRTATITILRKPGRDSYNTHKAYRPISLLSILGKLLESHAPPD